MTIILILLIISLLVAIHELGHFVAAKIFKIPVATFAIGFPPTLFSWKRRETTYKINLIPLGGYVNMADGAEDAYDSNLFKAPLWHQIIILLAGITFNLVSAFIVLWFVFIAGTQVPSATGNVTVSAVTADSAAQMAGITPWDVIKSVEMPDKSIVEISSHSDLLKAVADSKGKEITLTVDRAGTTETIAITPKTEGDSYRIGTELVTVTKERVAPGQAFVRSFQTIGSIWSDTWYSLGKLVSSIGQKDSGSMDQLSGPVGLVSDGSKMLRHNTGAAAISIFIILSVNLALLNLIPIPSLDGGQIVLAVIRKISSHRATKIATNILSMLGAVLILGLILVITYHDILKLIH